jgi:predicted phage terminase large subunit-like protein
VVSPQERQVVAERGTPALLGHYLDPRYELFDHVRLLSQKAVKLVSGEAPRQLWSVPPQHSKSETGARRLPLWFLDWFPQRRVVVASYGSDLAHGHGRWVRNTIRENADKLRVTLSPDSRAAYRWNTPQGGGLLATGVGGALTGFPADLLIIDDPFENWEAAQSESERDRVWGWYSTVARTRLQKGGSILVIQTRWHEEDLIGKLLDQDAEGTGEGWDYTRLPAIADHDPSAGETDPLGREPGQVLCEELHPLEEIKAAMRSAGPYLSQGLYQQHPRPPEGAMFAEKDWLEMDEDEPVPARSEFVGFVRGWDLAATEGGGDWTVGALLGRHRNGQTYVLDVIRDRRGSAGVELMLRTTTAWDRKKWGRRCQTRLEKEGGASGKSHAERLVEDVLGDYLGCEAVPSTGSKTTRALGWASAVADQQVVLCPTHPDRQDWVDAFVSEHASFPVGGKHDDQVDASSIAFNELRKAARVGRAIKMTSMADETILDGIAMGLG